MLFYTPAFLVFSLVLLAILLVVQRNDARKSVLLLASYVFYMWWNPAFIVLIVFSTGVDYVVGRRLAGEERTGHRRVLLVTSCVANLGLLGFFKYSGFLEDNTLALMRLMGFQVHWTQLHVILPVGISFYTFQTMSYTIDVYRRQLPATKSPIDFALFVAFFPQLVAGPIVRAADFLPQLDRPIVLTWDRPTFFLIARGLSKKVLIADNVATLADTVFRAPGDWPSVVIWLAAIAFAVQIYCDFSGYSDIAIGVARVLGFELPLNFDHPYLARNPSDFWRRWHISLSTWLRDYLYISMGGNRKGTWKTHRNLMVTMLLGGLWHGASWNFVIWGFLHGVALSVHRFYGSIRARLAGQGTSRSDGRGLRRWVAVLAMQLWVLMTWITFRVENFGNMTIALRKFVVFDGNLQLANLGLGTKAVFSTMLILAAFGILHLASRKLRGLERWLGEAPIPISLAACFALGFVAYLMWPLSEAPFIYFQF